MTKIKKLPKFKNIDEESDFWDNHSTTIFESEDVTKEFEKELKKSCATKKKMTIRLEPDLISDLKKAAVKYGVPYQKFTRELLRTGLSNVL